MPFTRRLACVIPISLGVLSGQGLDIMLVVDMSPGTEQAIGLIQPRVFGDTDRAGVVGAGRTSQVIQPLTDDREDLAAALRRAAIRVGVAVGGGLPININLTVDLASALRKACAEFEQDSSTGRKRAILVLFASDDPGLSAHLDAVQTALRTTRVRLFAVVIQRVDGQQGPLSARAGGYPVMTAQFISQLTKESGGRIYRSNWDLREILAAARKP